MGSSGRRRHKLLFIAATPLVAGRALPAATPTFTGITTGALANPSIDEGSGIAASRRNANVLWTHNDSGNSNEVFALTPAGANLGAYTITGAVNQDWEDIAVGPGPAAGTNYLYIGDIGDNSDNRASVRVYRIAEPAVSDTQSPVTASLSGVSTLTFAYPNGSHDAEAMFVDPLSSDVYIITKLGSTKYVYRAAYPQSTSSTTTVQLVASLSNASEISAADISSDGDEIIMRAQETTTGKLYIRPPGGSVADALATTPITIPLLAEANAEAIGFDPRGWGYYTTSEGAGAPIHYFNRLPPPAGTMYWDNDAVAAGSSGVSGAGLGGSGTWNASALKWYNASSDVAWASGNDAIFWGTPGTVTLAAAQSAQNLTFKSSGYVVTGSTLTLTGGSITVDAGVTATIQSILAGAAGLTKAGGGTLALTRSNAYSGATTVTAGTLRISPGSAAVMKTSAVSFAAGSKLDLADNKLIVTAMNVGSWTGSAYDGVTGLLQSGRGNGTWNGSGIVTSMTGATTSALTTLAVARAGDVGKSIFGGSSVSASDVLVMYTYGGDANLDGKLNIDDYVRIDQGIAGAMTGWSNGDFNYDGKIDIDDYTTVIDSNIGNQGAPFPAALLADAAAVPEPAGAALLLAGAAILARRSRKSV